VLWAASALRAQTAFEQEHIVQVYPNDEPRRMGMIPDVETPHVVLAKPLTGGPVRVLALAEFAWGRWPVELTQRFDCKVEVVYAVSSDLEALRPYPERYVAQQKIDVEARLLQAMTRPIDVVVCALSPAKMSSRVRQRLVGLIRRGVGYVGPTAGLDMSGYEADTQTATSLVRSAVPLAGLSQSSKDFSTPAEAVDKKATAVWKGPGGRIANVFGWRVKDIELDPARLMWGRLPNMALESYYSLLGRAMLWAARRLEADSALAVTWPAKPIKRTTLPAELSLRGSGSESEHLRILDLDGRVRHEGNGVNIPVLPAGRYFAVVTMGRGATQDWAFGTFEVSATPSIASVEVDARFKKPDETVGVKVTLSAAPPTGSKLRLDVLDNHGRCVSRQTVPAAQEAKLTGQVTESLTLYNYANVQLLGTDGQVVDEKRHSFYVAHPMFPLDDVFAVIWGGGGELHPQFRQVLHLLSEQGVHSSVAFPRGEGTDSARTEAYATTNMRPWCYISSLRSETKDNVRTYCITRRERMASEIRRHKHHAEYFKNFAPLVYSLGDDQFYVRKGAEACWSQTCRKTFGAYAEALYGSIKKLNQAWGTDWKDFGRVEPIRRAEVLAALEMAPPDIRPLRRWMDHQFFLDDLVVKWHGTMADAIHQGDPNGPANMTSSVMGWLQPGSATDFWRLAEGQRVNVQTANPVVNEIYRSAVKGERLHGMWYGGYGCYNRWPYYEADSAPWWMIFRRMNLHCLWHSHPYSQSYQGERFMMPDYGWQAQSDKVMANYHELRGGIAKLLLNAKRNNDGIAILYSQPSLHASLTVQQHLPKSPLWKSIKTGQEKYVYMRSWEGLAQLMGDMGLSFDVVPVSHLEDGSFLRRGFRVLVLPMPLRITDAEAKTIRQFVRGGGIIVADALVGAYDEQCRIGHGGVLADVFGVKYTEGLPGRQVVMTSVAVSGRQLGEWAVDGAVQLDGAEALGLTAEGKPVLTLNAFGKGKAILLNALAGEYQIYRTASTELAFRNTVEEILAKVGIKPKIRCTTKYRGVGELPLQMTEIHRFDLDGATYVGLLRSAKLRRDHLVNAADLRPKRADTDFGRKTHVYDVRNRVYRGYRSSIDDMILPARAALYALMPYEVGDLRVTAEADTGAALLVAQVVPGQANTEPITHVFHVELFDPQGRHRRELARNIVAKNGRCRERIFIGLNAEPGMWKATVRDVASGMERAAMLEMADR